MAYPHQRFETDAMAFDGLYPMEFGEPPVAVHDKGDMLRNGSLP